MGRENDYDYEIQGQEQARTWNLLNLLKTSQKGVEEAKLPGCPGNTSLANVWLRVAIAGTRLPQEEQLKT